MKVIKKVSKKIKLSKGKLNYRKHERRAIARFERRKGKKELRRVFQVGVIPTLPPYRFRKFVVG